MNKTDVYIASLPKDAPIGTVKCTARNEEMASISNEAVRREKYFVWRLLIYALENSFGISECDAVITKEPYGGWRASDVYVSLSHSGGAVAVAVSKSPVGIDIERVSPRISGRMAERIMTDSERLEYSNIVDEERDRRLTEIWTAKEAIFKSLGKDSFIPREYDTISSPVITSRYVIDGEEYACSVAGEGAQDFSLFTDIEL